MKKNGYQITGPGMKSAYVLSDDEGWVTISGNDEKVETPRNYYKILPTLYRGVDKRAKAISSLPWVILKGETEYETHDAYENKDGLIANMTTTLWLIEASLTLAGRSYWKREKNRANYDKLRHLDPTSMVLDEKQAINGNLVWKRSANSVTTELTTKEVVYFWYPDPYKEIGPPEAWPVASALNACGVLTNLDEFAKAYFARGAIKSMLFAMGGIDQAEKEKFEAWFTRFMTGIKNAFTTKVVNADKVQPIVIGEGIKELENVTITQEKREEIAAALDIPFAILFSNAANYATAERDKLNWYEDFVVPESEFIASILNEQVYKPLGLKLQFQPETLDIMQEDENERAQALKLYVDIGFTILQACEILGVELSDEIMADLKKEEERKRKQEEELANNPPQPAPVVSPPDNTPPVQEPPAKSIDDQQLVRELSIWQAKCLAALKRGETAESVSFVPVHIPSETYAYISDGLKTATTTEDVKAVFVQREEKAEPITVDPLFMLAAELKRANDIMEKAEA